MSRMDKVNNQMKRVISQIIQQEFGDPPVSFLTITHVDVSPDLKNAKVFFSVLGDDMAVKGAQRVLNKARGMIRHAVSQRMLIRHTPEMSFIHDQSLNFSVEIEERLKEIHDEQTENSQTDSEQ